MHQIIDVNPRAYGTTDLWSFDLLEAGRPLPCNNLRTFLHYLCSSGTFVASIGTYKDDPSAAIEVDLIGPRADDGEFLSISYKLTREEIHGDVALHEGLEGWEKRLLVERIMALRPPAPNNPWRLALRALAGLLKLPYAA